MFFTIFGQLIAQCLKNTQKVLFYKLLDLLFQKIKSSSFDQFIFRAKIQIQIQF